MRQIRARPLDANLGVAIVGEGGGFTQQQMNVLRHDNVPVNPHIEAPPHVLQASNEQVEYFVGSKVGTTAVTAKRLQNGTARIRESAGDREA